ncbi:hypothetical protein ON010_g7033 [Phytophthora cinnamomi]|nr:hypothetical protein ON010_g7033 [Phytophthora cinnamomi]
MWSADVRGIHVKGSSSRAKKQQAAGDRPDTAKTKNEVCITPPPPVKVTPQSQPPWYIPRSSVCRIEAPFASGGFGLVYHAQWSNCAVVEKEVCIKLDNEIEMERFKQEVEIWRNLRHDNVVPFYGANHTERPCFIVSSYATNGELLGYLKKKREQNPNEKIVWQKLFEVAAGLNYLHEQGVIHGDLKCNNIVVDQDGTAMLTDFGLSFLESGPYPMQDKKSTLGAMQWRAPEYATMTVTKPSFASDVYSLGMCIIEAVTGHMPWGAGMTSDEIKEKLRKGDQVVEKPDEMTVDQWKLVHKMIATRREDRPKMGEVLLTLKKFEQQERCPCSSKD